jgi:hypothetical protein
MSSTYSNLGIELIGTGEQAGTWGVTTNNNFSDIIDNAIVGAATIAVTGSSSGSPTVLTVSNGSASDGQKRILVASGALGAAGYLQISPNDFAGYYFIRNSTGQTLNVFQGTYSSGNAVAIENGYDAIIKCNGGGAGAVVSFINYKLKTGPLLVTNESTVGTVIEGSTSVPALRITQTGSGNALLVEDDANPDSTPVVINNSGQLVIGATTAPGSTTAGLSLTSDSASAPNSNILSRRNSTDSTGTTIDLYKARGSLAIPTTVVSGDNAGTITFSAYDGTNFLPTAQIKSSVDATPGTNDMPGNLVISTTADGASTLTTRLTVNSAGLVTVPGGLSGPIGATGATTGAFTTLNISNALSLSGAAGTSGQVLTSAGAGVVPTWETQTPTFEAGTRLAFQQSAAPTGWTIETGAAYNNAALRIITSGTAGTGGTAAFTTAFTSRTPAGTVATTNAGTTLSTSQYGLLSHSHDYTRTLIGSGSTIEDGSPLTSTSTTVATSTESDTTVSSHTHTATSTFTGTAMDFAVKYVDFIIATKN